MLTSEVLEKNFLRNLIESNNGILGFLVIWFFLYLEFFTEIYFKAQTKDLEIFSYGISYLNIICTFLLVYSFRLYLLITTIYWKEFFSMIAQEQVLLLILFRSYFWSLDTSISKMGKGCSNCNSIRADRSSNFSNYF